MSFSNCAKYIQWMLLFPRFSTARLFFFLNNFVRLFFFHPKLLASHSSALFYVCCSAIHFMVQRKKNLKISDSIIQHWHCATIVVDGSRYSSSISSIFLNGVCEINDNDNNKNKISARCYRRDLLLNAKHTINFKLIMSRKWLSLKRI